MTLINHPDVVKPECILSVITTASEHVLIQSPNSKLLAEIKPSYEHTSYLHGLSEFTAILKLLSFCYKIESIQFFLKQNTFLQTILKSLPGKITPIDNMYLFSLKLVMLHEICQNLIIFLTRQSALCLVIYRFLQYKFFLRCLFICYLLVFCFQF